MKIGKWDIKMSFSDVAKSLIRSRGGLKSRITITLRDLEGLSIGNALPQDHFERQQTHIIKYLDKIDIPLFISRMHLNTKRTF